MPKYLKKKPKQMIESQQPNPVIKIWDKSVFGPT